MTKSTLAALPVPEPIDAILATDEDRRSSAEQSDLMAFFRSVTPALAQERAYLAALQRQLCDALSN
jgi:hypothetical protein